MKKKASLYTFALVAAILGFSSCEGYRGVGLLNRTAGDIQIKASPATLYSWSGGVTLLSKDSLAYSMTLRLKPNAFIGLGGHFTTMMVPLRKLEGLLLIDSMEVYTPYDTIVAHSRKDIMALTYDTRTRYRKRLDGKRALAKDSVSIMDLSNCIIIRK